MATIAERQSAFARATDDSYRLAREPWYVNNCPNCHKEMNPSAVLCVKCGYHRGLGKRMKTEEIEATEPIVSRESVFTDDDPTILGLPMMPVLCSSGIALVMAALLYWVAPVALLVICVLGGLLVIGAGWFWLLYLAFSEDLVQGLLVWLVPFYFFYYVYSRWHEVRLAAVLYFIGIALIIAPFMLGIRIGTS